MQLHQLQRHHPQKRKKTRVGRGGKRGTTAGHGTKGQRSRAGHRIRPAERDYIQRLPKLRGSGDRVASEKPVAVNLGRLARISSLREITPEALVREGIIRRGRERHVKILGTGTVDRPMVVRGIPVSKSARASIEAAGGSVHK